MKLLRDNWVLDILAIILRCC